MKKLKSDSNISIMEAVDNLSSMAELSEEGSLNAEWLDPQRLEPNRKKIKDTFHALNQYLHHMYEKEKAQLKDPETQKGIQAIMVLAGEAAQKLSAFTSLFKGTHVKGVPEELAEYTELQQFYLTKLMKRFEESLEIEESWQKEWGSIESDASDIQKQGLKDLETVRRDREYELFYIQREDGGMFFNPNLLRHIKLIGNFDASVADQTGEDPLLKTRLLQDRELHESAKEILRSNMPHIDAFFQEAMRHKEKEWIAVFIKALMALMLSANARNLLLHTMGKSCSAYFSDFQMFLRLALSSEEYRDLIAHSPASSERFSQVVVNLSYALCNQLFLREVDRKELMRLIDHICRKPPKSSGMSVWERLLHQDEQLRLLLKKYPHGPLLKTLDIFREGEAREGFDPFRQENLPSLLFNFSCKDVHVSCLKIPCPVRQEMINQAEVIEEFKGFLRSLKGRHLMVNLQDRTSWQEHARCTAVESLQKTAEFADRLVVVTLAKNTDFYNQAGSYLNLKEASQFIDQFREQINTPQECGFYFPPTLDPKEIDAFAKKGLKIIHEQFFDARPHLTRKERLDFIELFYHLLVLKITEMIRPDSLSFTCKDAVDTGAAASASLFGLINIMSGDKAWSEGEIHQLSAIFYAPAFLLRERAIDEQRFNRALSMLSHTGATYELHRSKIAAAIAQILFPSHLL